MNSTSKHATSRMGPVTAWPGKRIRPWFSEYKWHVTAAMWALALVLGYLGFRDYFLSVGEQHTPLDILYRALQLFQGGAGAVPGSIGWQLEIARFLAPIMLVYTTAQVLATVFQYQVQQISLRFVRNQVVICGLGQKGFLLTEGFRQMGKPVVVVEQNEHNDMLERCREIGASTLIGNAADSSSLRRAGIHRADYVISVCGNDGTNAEVAVNAHRLVQSRKGKSLLCLVHIVDMQLCELLREREMAVGRIDAFRLEFFNVFESGARVLVSEYPPFGKMGDDPRLEPHIVVVGLGYMGESVVVNAARQWRDKFATETRRLRINLVDKEAIRRTESLLYHYPELERVCDLVPEQMDTQSREFEQASFLFGRLGDCDVKAIYICLDDDSRALSAALKLNQRIRNCNIPIVVCMGDDAGLSTLLRNEGGVSGFANLHAFSLLGQTCTPDLVFGCTYEILSRAFHSDYVARERDRGLTPEKNPSMAPWEELPEALKESNRGQVQHIRAKLEAIGCDIAMTREWSPPPFPFSPEEVELMAKMEHQRFVEERLRGGWKVGSEKDIEKKINPTLVPWDQLPEEEKDKDRNTVSGIPEFLSKAGYQVYRSKNSRK